jgi:DmsE family decaheme c-type cytochrome
MKKLMKIKQILMVALQTAALGTALLGSAVYAADVAKPAPVLASTTPTDLVLKGDAKCTACHDEGDSPKVLGIAKNKHGVRADGRTPTCTSCHGESPLHINKPDGVKDRQGPDRTFGKKSKTPVAERVAVCLSCHEKEAKRHQWTGSQHQVNDVACTNCHEVHTGHDKVRDKKTQPEVCYACHKEQRADSKKMSHHPIGEGKVTCSDCHNAHGSSGPKLLKKNTLNETCYSCHAEKRGPFLFEHQPVTEDCSNCHTPHGSNITPLLKSRAPFLCQECHDGSHTSGTPVGPNASFKGSASFSQSTQRAGNSCMNCHNMVHGSNSPAGGYLQR